MLSTVTEFAKAKVNLALHVLGRRDDGYHDLDSIVAFASVADELAVTAAVGQGAAVSLTVSGPFAAAVPVDDSNLICSAHALLSEQCRYSRCAVHLTKNLPVAAGIGGGSADAAAALRALSSAWSVPPCRHDAARNRAQAGCGCSCVPAPVQPAAWKVWAR